MTLSDFRSDAANSPAGPPFSKQDSHAPSGSVRRHALVF
jgi:hypothetical protein